MSQPEINNCPGEQTAPPFHLYTGCRAAYQGDKSYIFKGINPQTGEPVFYGEWPGTTHRITAPVPGGWGHARLVLRSTKTKTIGETITVGEFIGLVKAMLPIDSNRQITTSPQLLAIQVSDADLQNDIFSAATVVARHFMSDFQNPNYAAGTVYLISKRFDLGLIPAEYIIVEQNPPAT